MELGRRIASMYVFESLRRRLSAFQIASTKTGKHSEKIKTARGLVLIFLALIFAWISLEATAASSIARYRIETWPRESTFVRLMNERGLVRRLQLGEYSRQLQSHPDAFSNEAMIWVTTDACIVYLSAPGFGDLSSQLWTCETNPKPPASWLKVGSGLDGFEKLQDFIEKRHKPAVSAVQIRRNIVDPREIRY